MRSTTRALLTAILFTTPTARALTCPPPGTQDLVGLWESRETSKGGIGHAVEFRPDGTYAEAPTVIVELPYQVSGDRLILKEGPETRFEIQGDTLTQTRPDGSRVRKERLGKAVEGSPAIVGVWRYRHDTGVTAFETDAGLVPSTFDAVTVNVYATPFVSPVTRIGLAEPVTTMPPGDDVTV